jgi:hypothetical protein
VTESGEGRTPQDVIPSLRGTSNFGERGRVRTCDPGLKSLAKLNINNNLHVQLTPCTTQQNHVDANKACAELWNAMTRPLTRNGLGLTVARPSEVRAIEAVMTLLPDSEGVYRDRGRACTCMAYTSATTLRVRYILWFLVANAQVETIPSTADSMVGRPVLREQRCVFCSLFELSPAFVQRSQPLNCLSYTRVVFNSGRLQNLVAI